jgi:arylsulfatase A-like enzyme
MKAGKSNILEWSRCMMGSLGGLLKHPVRAGLLAALCLTLSCGQEHVPLNVVILGIDTLRHDHLGCYGYGRSTSPVIDALAVKGVLFENCIAPSPWTLPSFASLFTSLYPSQHGAVHFRRSMRPDCPTLAEILRDAGYATGAIINAPYLKAKYEIDRGFEFYGMPRELRNADDTTRDALAWIDKIAERPFFIFVHYFDPHLPYSPPEPYDTIFDPDYAGGMKTFYLPKRLPAYRSKNFVEMKSIPEEDWNHIRSLYDGEVAFTDQAIGTLLEKLAERGLDNNTLVVLLSDHGEEFFDHEGFEHGHSLYNELIKVPLILCLPGVLPGDLRISRQVRLIDVAPTILDILGIDLDPSFEGVSVEALLENPRSSIANEEAMLPPEIAYAEALLYGAERKSVVAYPWKIIYQVSTGKKSCFNLAEDPGEHHDIADDSSHSISLLEEILFNTLINISDTWFVELVGGDREHTFDIEISSEVIKGSGRFELHKVIAAGGRMLSTEDLENAKTTPYEIEIEGLRVREPITLALKLRRKDAPMGFYFRIDGEPAIERTYIGESLQRPAAMPFSERDAPMSPSDKGEPTTRPDPPYILVWLSKNEYGGDTTIELDEETRNELRSLGYIQ